MRGSRVRRWGATVAVVVVAVPLAAFGAWQVASARTFQFFGSLTSAVAADEKVVALTFDDGPDPAGTAELLAVLAGRHVSATFYLIGRDIEENPGPARDIAAAGHEIGNHTYSHERMVLVGPGFAAEEVERTDRLIRGTGYTGDITFRPPNGKKLLVLPYYLARHDRETVMWDVEPNSYPDVDRTAEAITEHVATNVRQGSIILLHGMYPGREETRKAVGPVIDRLRAQGYRFVTVSELLTLGPAR